MAHGLPAEGGRITIAAVAFGNPTGRLRRHSLGGADLPPVAASFRSHPAATEAVATGRSHALRGEGAEATAALSNTTGRLRRHSLGGADLLPADPSSRSHPAATEAVATGGSHALRGEGAEATAALSNTTGRLRRHSLGGADLPPVDPSSRSHHAATEAVATGRSHALRGEGAEATTALSNTTGRLRRHSLGGADLPPVDPSSRSHHAATEAVATGGSHALRGEGAEATAAAGNTTGRLRRHSLGGADLPPVAASPRSHPAA